MRLLIVSPDQVVADLEDVAAVRAEDQSGEFGIWPRHADFITALAISVVGWRHGDGRWTYCAVRGGLMTVSGGNQVSVATREAILGDDLAELEAVVRARIAAEAAQEAAARASAERLRLQAIRQIIGYLRPEAAAAGAVRR